VGCGLTVPLMPKGEKMVRINIVLPESEREAFDKWCRYGGKPKVSMNRRLRALLLADVQGQIPIPRKAGSDDEAAPAPAEPTKGRKGKK
jgi:hypothetical protein